MRLASAALIAAALALPGVAHPAAPQRPGLCPFYTHPIVSNLTADIAQPTYH
jgi:hypothetical protein